MATGSRRAGPDVTFSKKGDVVVVVRRTNLDIIQATNAAQIATIPGDTYVRACFNQDSTRLAVAHYSEADGYELRVFETTTWQVATTRRISSIQELAHDPGSDRWILGGDGLVRSLGPTERERELFRLPRDSSFDASIKSIGWIHGRISATAWSGAMRIGDLDAKRPAACSSHRSLLQVTHSRPTPQSKGSNLERRSQGRRDPRTPDLGDVVLPQRRPRARDPRRPARLAEKGRGRDHR